jgi:hypothetical protein
MQRPQCALFILDPAGPFRDAEELQPATTPVAPFTAR